MDPRHTTTLLTEDNKGGSYGAPLSSGAYPDINAGIRSSERELAYAPLDENTNKFVTYAPLKNQKKTNPYKLFDDDKDSAPGEGPVNAQPQTALPPAPAPQQQALVQQQQQQQQQQPPATQPQYYPSSHPQHANFMAVVQPSQFGNVSQQNVQAPPPPAYAPNATNLAPRQNDYPPQQQPQVTQSTFNPYGAPQSQFAQKPQVRHQCDYCGTAQMIPQNAKKFMCFHCRNINKITDSAQPEKAMSAFICGKCAAKVVYEQGISKYIKCGNCQAVNLAPDSADANQAPNPYAGQKADNYAQQHSNFNSQFAAPEPNHYYQQQQSVYNAYPPPQPQPQPQPLNVQHQQPHQQANVYQSAYPQPPNTYPQNAYAQNIYPPNAYPQAQHAPPPPPPRTAQQPYSQYQNMVNSNSNY